jgi:hypothetical protein
VRLQTMLNSCRMHRHWAKNWHLELRIKSIFLISGKVLVFVNSKGETHEEI